MIDAGAMAGSHDEHRSMLSFQVRAGILPALVDSADIEGGWTVNLGPFFGYRYDVRRDDRDEEQQPVEKTHSLTEGVALDVTRWWATEVGLSLRLEMALVSPVARSENDVWRGRVGQSGDFHHAHDIRGSVGVAF
jgi:hypothetical protein